MEATAPFSRVEVDDRSRLLVALGAVVLVGAGVADQVVMRGFWTRPSLPAFAIAALAVTAVFVRGGVREVDFTPAGIVLRTRDGVARALPREQVGGIGLAGKVAFGRTVDLALPIGGANASTNSCRLVVVDRWGRAITARRAGWLDVRRLEHAVVANGYAWLGVHIFSPRPIDLSPAAWPAGVDVPAGETALDDGPTKGALHALRRRSRSITLGFVAVLVGAPLLAAVADHTVLSSDSNALTTVAVIAAFAAFFGVCVAPLRSRTWRRARALLSGQRWMPVEAVVLSSSRRDGSKRTVVLIDRATGSPMRTLAVEGGGERGWLQPLDRAWFLIAIDEHRHRAALAPLDRSAIAVLEVRDKTRDQDWSLRALATFGR
ncbi:MAG: hypothetical protein JWN46_3262 [Acidimicrobiales bacterium]|nr:hypothetical protein [Acidimicrobiales bacterium]